MKKTRDKKGNNKSPSSFLQRIHSTKALVSTQKTMIVGIPLITAFLMIGDMIMSGNSINYFNMRPITISDWLGSRWLFFVFFSGFILFLWKNLAPNIKEAVDFTEISNNGIFIPSIRINAVVFECKPPLINQIQELKFLTASFRP